MVDFSLLELVGGSHGFYLAGTAHVEAKRAPLTQISINLLGAMDILANVLVAYADLSCLIPTNVTIRNGARGFALFYQPVLPMLRGTWRHLWGRA